MSEPGLLDGLRTGDWLDRQTFPDLTWIVNGLIPEGFALLIGGPKIGKSWLSLDISLAVAAGGRAVGAVPVESRPVLLLALEDGDRRLQDRARKLLINGSIPGRLHYMTKVLPGQLVPTVEAWLDSLDHDGPPPLVFLDTLGKVMPPKMMGETDYMRDYRVAGRLKALADSWPGMGLVALHHDRKALSEDFVDAVSGTNGIAGAADTIIVINRRRTEEEGRFLVTGRDVNEREYAVSISGCRWSLDGGSLDAAADAAVERRTTNNLGDRSADIMRYAAAHPEGIRAKDVADHLDISQDIARIYLNRLADADRLSKPKRGVFVGAVTSVTSVTTDSNERNTHNEHNTTPRCCYVCGFPMTELGDGATAHPACQEQS